MLVKAILGQDIRVVSVPRSIPFEELKRGLELKYGKAPLTITYEV